MRLDIKNIFSNIEPASPAESFDTVAAAGNVRIERIVSHGQATPEGEWYDQDWDEWVMLVSGEAGLILEGEATPLSLSAGDHIMLPAGRRHRVEWTSPTETTVWLAVHIYKN